MIMLQLLLNRFLNLNTKFYYKNKIEYDSRFYPHIAVVFICIFGQVPVFGVSLLLNNTGDRRGLKLS